MHNITLETNYPGKTHHQSKFLPLCHSHKLQRPWRPTTWRAICVLESCVTALFRTTTAKNGKFDLLGYVLNNSRRKNFSFFFHVRSSLAHIPIQHLRVSCSVRRSSRRKPEICLLKQMHCAKTMAMAWYPTGVVRIQEYRICTNGSSHACQRELP